MPFGLKWPFGRKNKANQAQASAPASEPLNVQRMSASEAPSPANEPLASEPRTFELGAEVLNRAAGFGALPTLGQDAGLGIAQNVGETQHFIEHLPLSTPLFAASDVPDTSDFVASLASLSSFTNLESTPVLMGELIAPSGLTDELPPLGSLPNQLPGLMGVAPITPDTGAVLPPMPMMPPLQAVEPVETPAPRESAAPVPMITALPDMTPPAINAQPFETIMPLNVERPFVAPIVPAAPDEPLPVPANFAAPAPVIEGKTIEPSEFISPSTPSDPGSPTVPSLALNTFSDALPLIALPGEANEVEAVTITSNITRDVVPTLDLPAKTGDFEPTLTLPGLAPAIDSAASEGASPAEPAAPTSAPLSISRYAEDLPLPTTIVPRDEIPSALSVPPVVAPLPPFSPPEEMPALFEPLSMGEVAQEFLATPIPIDQSPVDQSPVTPSASDQPATSEPAVSISRYAEDLPLIDVNFGWSNFDLPTREPDFAADQSLPIETESLAMSGTPDMALPSIGERADRATQSDRVAARPERAPISISRSPADMPLNRATTLNQVTHIQRFSLGSLTQNLPSLSGVTDQLPALGGLAQNIPSLGGMAENLPALGGLTDNLPSLGGLAESIGGGLPQLPSLGGLASSQMPLPPSISEAIGGVGGAGQEALGQITSMAPSMPEMPAMPQLPSIEKLTDQVWREIQKKLKIERERTRGLA